MSLRRRLWHLLSRRPDTPAAPTTRPTSPAAAPRPWRPLDPALRGQLTALLDPALRTALEGDRPTALLRPLAPGLFRLPVLTPEARSRLLAELAHAQAAADRGALPLAPPNSMNRAGLQLSEIGLAPLAEALCAEVVTPLAAAFPDLGPVTLGAPHGFSVRYGSGADRGLGFHADDATVTLNLCLESDADGAEVVFEGVRCLRHRQSPSAPHERVVWAPRPGEALLHLGAHRHRTLPISAGHRTNLVLWTRDTERIDLGPCGPWCRDAG